MYKIRETARVYRSQQTGLHVSMLQATFKTVCLGKMTEEGSISADSETLNSSNRDTSK